MCFCINADIFCPFLSSTFFTWPINSLCVKTLESKELLSIQTAVSGIILEAIWEDTSDAPHVPDLHTRIKKLFEHRGRGGGAGGGGANRFLHGQVEPSRARFPGDSYKFLWFPWKQKNPIRTVLSISWHRLSTNLITHRARGGNSFFPANTVRSFYAWQIEAKSRAPLPNAAFHLYALK